MHDARVAKKKAQKKAEAGPLELEAWSDEQLEALRKTAGAEVLRCRELLGLSQRALAKLCGRTNPWLTRIENGETMAPPALIAALANATAAPGEPADVGRFYGQALRAGVARADPLDDLDAALRAAGEVAGYLRVVLETPGVAEHLPATFNVKRLDRALRHEPGKD